MDFLYIFVIRHSEKPQQNPTIIKETSNITVTSENKLVSPNYWTIVQILFRFSTFWNHYFQPNLCSLHYCLPFFSSCCGRWISLRNNQKVTIHRIKSWQSFTELLQLAPGCSQRAHDAATSLKWSRFIFCIGAWIYSHLSLITEDRITMY